MEPTHDHDDDPAPDLSGLDHDPEPTTGAPDAATTSSPTTKKRRVNDGPTGRARRAEGEPEQ